MHNRTHTKEHKWDRMILGEESTQADVRRKKERGREGEGWKGGLGPSSPGEGPFSKSAGSVS